MKPNEIYKTPEQWGSETHYFKPSKRDEFMTFMRDCFETDEIADPIEYVWDDKMNAYEHYSHGISYYVRVIDWADESGLIVEEFDTFDLQQDEIFKNIIAN